MAQSGACCDVRLIGFGSMWCQDQATFETPSGDISHIDIQGNCGITLDCLRHISLFLLCNLGVKAFSQWAPGRFNQVSKSCGNLVKSQRVCRAPRLCASYRASAVSPCAVLIRPGSCMSLNSLDKLPTRFQHVLLGVGS